MGIPDFGCVVLLPYPVPFIISPTWVHIPPLGPQRVNSPLPLALTLGQAWNDGQEVDAAKKKDKSIINVQREDVLQNAKDGQDKHI